MDNKKSPLDGFSADDILKSVYPNTILLVAKDMDKQVDDYQRYLDGLSDPKEREEVTGKIVELTGKTVAILTYYVAYFAVGPEEREMCIKYKVDHTY